MRIDQRSPITLIVAETAQRPLQASSGALMQTTVRNRVVFSNRLAILSAPSVSLTFQLTYSPGGVMANDTPVLTTAPAAALGAAPAAFDSRKATRTLIVASGGAIVAFLDVSIVNVAFPSLQKSFATASLADLSWVLN